jgi:hypothetical protein
MNPILMSLSSVQSLTHDHRARFEPRLHDKLYGVDTLPVPPQGFLDQVISWLGRGALPNYEVLALGFLWQGR